MCIEYLLLCSLLEKCGKLLKNNSFYRWIRPNLGTTTQSDMAGLGSKGMGK